MSFFNIMAIDCSCEEACDKKEIDYDCIQCKNVGIKKKNNIFLHVNEKAEINEYKIIDGNNCEMDAKRVKKKIEEAYNEYMENVYEKNINN